MQTVYTINKLMNSSILNNHNLYSYITGGSLDILMIVHHECIGIIDCLIISDLYIANGIFTL